MLRGLYEAATGMTAQQRRHDTVTNNISNINTPGYKQANVVTRSFPEVLLAMTGVEGAKHTTIGKWTAGVFAEESLSIYQQGDLSQTNQSSDFALISNIDVDGLAFDASGKAWNDQGELVFQPQAFFTVQTPSGDIRYTRGGKFSVTGEGLLKTSDGSSVLGIDGQAIQLPIGVSLDSLILSDNQRFLDNEGNDIGAQLLITRIDNPNDLVREGTGHFRLANPNVTVEPIAEGERIEVRQGYVELSNVDAAQASVELIAALRAYESNQKVIQFYDQTLQKTVNDIGRV